VHAAAVALLLIAVAVFLLSRQLLRGATIFSLAAWLVLGFFASTVAQEPKPKNYILNVIESDQLDLLTPLRWHGTLRDEPAAPPWGISYEIELTSGEYQERSIFPRKLHHPRRTMTRSFFASSSASAAFFCPATQKNFPSTTCFPYPVPHLCNRTF